MTYYYYWRATHRMTFLRKLEASDPQIRMLVLGRANLLLERLQREGKAPKLSQFKIDVESDWEKHKLYPTIPDSEETYFRVHQVPDSKDNSLLQKRFRSNSSLPSYPSHSPKRKKIE